LRVAELENPAGRLHALLSAFGNTPPNGSIASAWAAVLDVPEGELYLHLGAVGTLIGETREAAQRIDSPHLAAMPEHLNTLSECVFPHDVTFSQTANNLRPNPFAMQMLGMLSIALQQTSVDGRIPDNGELEDLITSARDLLADVLDADLPPEIRRDLVDRLNGMLAALEHLNVGGPTAVRKAAEALAISAALHEDASRDERSLFQRIKKTAKVTWIAFSIATQIATATLTWDRIVDGRLLGSAQEQRQLPPGPSPDDPPHDGGDPAPPTPESASSPRDDGGDPAPPAAGSDPAPADLSID
jgi:hypothetical protein